MCFKKLCCYSILMKTVICRWVKWLKTWKSRERDHVQWDQLINGIKYWQIPNYHFRANVCSVHLLIRINRLLESVFLCPKVIPLSGAYCIIDFKTKWLLHSKCIVIVYLVSGFYLWTDLEKLPGLGLQLFFLFWKRPNSRRLTCKCKRKSRVYRARPEVQSQNFRQSTLVSDWLKRSKLVVGRSI